MKRERFVMMLERGLEGAGKYVWSFLLSTEGEEGWEVVGGWHAAGGGVTAGLVW